MYADKSKAEYWRAYADWLRQMARHTTKTTDTSASLLPTDSTLEPTQRVAPGQCA
jgi:hypothetical protein